jgi:sugar transferase (PEP-CTERM system associated)
MFRVLARHFRGRVLLLMACEYAILVWSVVIAAWFRLGEGGWFSFAGPDELPKAMFIAMACQFSLYYANLYDLRTITDRRDLFTRIVQALAATSFLLAAVYFFVPSLVIARGVFIVAACLMITTIAGWRLGFEWVTRRMAPRERLLLVGTTDAAITLARELFQRRHELGVDIVGFVDPDPAKVGKAVLNPGVIGTIEDIPSIVRARGVDRVVVSLADARGQLPMETLLEMKVDRGVVFDHLASVYEEYTGKIAIENLRPSWLIFSGGFRKTKPFLGLKRVVDLASALIGILLLWPVMLAVAALIKITSPGPVLFHQARVGQYGRVFTVHKFRSMCADAEARTGAVWTRPGDARITPLGRILRRTRLDELPQLWNVFVGDMSLIGPRPERPEFVTKLTEQIPFYSQRHLVRPGLTGWAQVRYTYGASVEDAMEKLQYDLFYIKNMSIALDMLIIIETIKTVLWQRGQ